MNELVSEWIDYHLNRWKINLYVWCAMYNVLCVKRKEEIRRRCKLIILTQ